MTEWIASIGPFLIVAIFSAGGVVMLLRFTQKDVNGLGRQYRRSLAFQLRALAEEEPINKAKLMHLADLIDPK